MKILAAFGEYARAHPLRILAALAAAATVAFLVGYYVTASDTPDAPVTPAAAPMQADSPEMFPTQATVPDVVADATDAVKDASARLDQLTIDLAQCRAEFDGRMAEVSADLVAAKATVELRDTQVLNLRQEVAALRRRIYPQ